MEHYLGVAKDKGITENEIGAAQSIVMAVSAGRITAQFKEVRKKNNITCARNKIFISQFGWLTTGWSWLLTWFSLSAR